MPSKVKLKTAMIATTELDEKKPCRAALADPFKVDVTRLPTEEIEDISPADTQDSRTILHIYSEQECGHKVITPTLSLPQERRFGPKPKEQKARRIAKKAARKLRESSQIPPSTITTDKLTVLPDTPESAKADKDQYYLHTPYLSFHLPPSVLYVGSSRYASSTPVALVHTGWFWRSYKIQLGPSLACQGVIDPRGVVSWQHNGGPKSTLQEDERNGSGRLLKGYKVRGWRLWGETGKKYVHGIRDKRKNGVVFDDPDVESESKRGEKACADEVVYLTWTRPLSRHTRLYTFYFRGIEFQWKGTGTVSEGRKCGWMLRFCHLKLVAKVPVETQGGKDGVREICLGKYTSSIAAEKSGTLEVFDHALLRFVEQYVPSLLPKKIADGDKEYFQGELEEVTMLKGSTLYQLIVATVICMANAEKEKRHTLIDLVIGILENAGNGGG